MQIQDAGIIRLVERIGEHYRNNISNRFLRPALLQMPIGNQSWDMLEDLTEHHPQTVILEELYRQVLAAAQFVSAVRHNLIPGIKNRMLRLDTSSQSPQDKVLKDMAVSAFTANLQVFSDMVNELFIKLVETDKLSAKGRSTVFSQMPELSIIGRLLVEE